jgi:peptide/nickel transport system substrate-binding protein
MKNITLIFLSILVITACRNTQTDTSNLDIFHYNEVSSVTSLDPAFARNQSNIWVVNQVFSTLIQLDDSLKVEPCVAKSWTTSADGLTYTFTIRDDVFFHDNDCFINKKGRRVVAEDVRYSFNRIIDAEVGSTGSWLLNGKIDTLQAFSAPNDSTFILKLSQPFRPMLGICGMQYFSIVPKEAVDFYGANFRANPVGTGAFQFRKWIENQALILTKNPNYFETDKNGKRLPYLDGIRVNFVNDRNTAYLNFRIKKLDFLSGLESSYVDDVLKKDGTLRPENADKMQFFKTPFLNSEYLGISQAIDGDSPLKIKKVRQALNYGFDRAKMLRELRNSVGQPATSGFTPIGLPSFDAEKVKGYDYNPAKARQLLAEAGFPNGKGMSEIKLYTNNDYLDLCTFITRQWEDLGVKVKIELLESATLREMMKKGQATFFRASWIMDYPDAENYMSLFYSKNPAPPNYTRFNNPKFDALYELALRENDDNKRFDLYQQMERIIIEEAPVIFLFYDETARFAAKNVNGLRTNASNLLTLKEVRMK